MDIAGRAVGTEDSVERRWQTFDRWSGNLFLLLAVMGLVVGLTVGGLASGSYPAIAVAGTLVVLGLWSVVLYVVAAGLDRGRGWARPTAWVLLVVLVATGLVALVVDLAPGRLTIPLELIAAAAVMTRKPGALPALQGGDRRIGAGLSVVFLATSLGAGAPAWLATAPGSPLTVGSDALDVRLDVGCPAADAQRIPVSASWTWRDRDVFPFGTDGLGVAWAWAGETGDELPFDAQSIEAPAWLWLGGGSPSEGAVEEGMAGARALQHLSWGIDVSRGGSADAGVAFELIPLDARPGATFGHGSLTVWAVYAHLDRWTVRQETTCDW